MEFGGGGEKKVVSMEQSKMEGWLYLIRHNRLGLRFFKKRYFILQENHLACFKGVPTSTGADPIRSSIIDSCLRITDNGREIINGDVFFIFTVYNPSYYSGKLKLGAKSSEEAARWMCCLMEAALKERRSNEDNFVNSSRRRWSPLRLINSSCSRFSTGGASLSSVDSMKYDVIAPSPWTIFGCKNGLRLFKEAKEGDNHSKFWDDHPAIMAVGFVDETPESIFKMFMSLGATRSEWDFCFSWGRVVQHIDGHNDIIHKKLKSDWLPWGMRPRDLLLQRYWRREDDGTYVILYHSVLHENFQPEKGCVRAFLKSGGYVLSPVNCGRQSVVKHMLAIDWKLWPLNLVNSSSREITIRMLGRIAALRELFRAKNGTCYNSGSPFRDVSGAGPKILNAENLKSESQLVEKDLSEDFKEEPQRSSSELTSSRGSFFQLNEAAADEFFDTLDESEYEFSENMWSSSVYSTQPSDQIHGKVSPSAVFVQKLHQLVAVQKKGPVEFQDDPILETAVSCSYGATLARDSSCTEACSWWISDPHAYLIRGNTYLKDRIKIKASEPLMQMVAADWLQSDKREDDLGGRPGGIVQKYTMQGSDVFFFIVNIQVPGATTYSLALYYMMNSPVQRAPLLQKFVEGDDAFRNSRFKLIPYISKGSWIVKQSVGKKACLIGQALDMNYFHGKNYLELGVDIGSSSVARGVVGLVLGYLTNLVIEMAFLIQGETPDELPEFLLGTCRLNHLDASRSISVKTVETP